MGLIFRFAGLMLGMRIKWAEQGYAAPRKWPTNTPTSQDENGSLINPIQVGPKLGYGSTILTPFNLDSGGPRVSHPRTLKSSIPEILY